MAKLNVKVLDMQNGEITKVAYEGAEYAKVDSAETGDLLQSKEDDLDIDVGEFYLCDGIDSDSDVEFEDNVGDHRTRSYDDYVPFRKISAQPSPTLEERVTDLETEVASLKGEKVEAEKPREYKVGDTVKVVANTAGTGSKERAGYHIGGQGIAKVGTVGKVTAVGNNFVTAKFKPEDVEKGYSTLSKQLRFDEIELAEETIEFEGATYRKVDREAREGDVVIFRKNTSGVSSINKPYKAITHRGELSFVGDIGNTYYLYSDRYERTRETVDVYEPIEQSKYVPQEGDIVVITGNTNSSRNKVGDIGKIRQTSMTGTKGAWVDVPQRPDSSDAYGNYTKLEEFRKATPAEVEKYEQAVKDAEIMEKWAKIGRKPNEFKKGDSVFVTHPDGGKIYGIIHEDSCGHKIKVDFGKQYRICTEDKSDLTLVAPVESTVA